MKRHISTVSQSTSPSSQPSPASAFSTYEHIIIVFNIITIIYLPSSGLVANLELWECSEVLFRSFELHSFPLPFPSFPLPSLIWWRNFNDFRENQLIIDFAFLCKPTWRKATVSSFSLVLISFGGRVFPHKIFGEWRSPRSPSTTPLSPSPSPSPSVLSYHASTSVIHFQCDC